jgi:predicted enzyme related to lactoylglutathione lyase
MDGEHGGLILLTFPERPAPPTGEVILGLTTPDLGALIDKVVAAGGAIHTRPFTSNEAVGIQFAFVTDPEGHLTELVQLA